ncbi:hypothetical protein AB0J01_28125 [Streptomyces sp. NPDC050204]|uniref:hypothetical protein n=1 Tax=Streptomyces sp. NPDC050204 TaxID=3155514 RepID=UPI0034123B03
MGHDLYDRSDYFRWTSNYTENDREAGAIDMMEWLSARHCNMLTKIIAHSHGGNVALTAAARSRVDLRVQLLVLLSTPAHDRTSAEWDVISRNVQRIIAMRSKFDLVVLSDRLHCWVAGTSSTRRFPAERVRHLPVSVWFSHGALTDPAVWKKHQLALEVAYEYRHSVLSQY